MSSAGYVRPQDLEARAKSGSGPFSFNAPSGRHSDAYLTWMADAATGHPYPPRLIFPPAGQRIPGHRTGPVLFRVRRMIPVDVDWPRLFARLRKAGLNDDQIADRMSRQGVTVDRSTLVYMRQGRTKRPRYDIGAALVNLLEGIPE